MDTGASFSRVMRKRAWTAEPEILVRREVPAEFQTSSPSENALRWLNRNEAEGLTNMVESTQRRLGAVIKLKGARTSY